MKILVTGGDGQLGRALVRRVARGHVIVAPDVRDLDICDRSAVAAQLDAFTPNLVINAAAYTAVDKAETEPELAYRVNRDGAAVVSRECARRSTRLLHISTDYVFDGVNVTPYGEEARPNPLSVYGASKAAGEAAVLETGGTVVRTSWLFFEQGANFVRTIVRLARERPVLRVVTDQTGCPTYAGDLAEALLALGSFDVVPSILHYSSDGAASWCDFARAIVAEARNHAPLACERVEAIPSSEYPTPAKRPAYSVLDTTRVRALGIVPRPWLSGLRDAIPYIVGEE